MMIKLLNQDNMTYNTPVLYNLIYCDYIYENLDFAWAKKYFQFLADDGVMIAQTDFHSQHRYRVYMEDVVGAKFVSHLVWKCEWGNHPKNKFHQCYDDILVYSKGNHNFFPEKIQIPKKTITKGLNPSGRTTKQATAWIDDITLTTTAKERVKKNDGHLMRWQKPLALYDRVILPFINEERNVRILDPFAGSGSLGKWSKEKGFGYLGIEYDTEVYNLALKNIGD